MEPRHFTIVDDWVLLHGDITSTQFRIYALIKGNIRHTYGGTPETGFRVTAAWVVAVSGEMFSLDTARKALQALARQGVLRRLNDPHSGDGSEFEFVVDPGPQHKGPRSVMTQAQGVEKAGRRGAAFTAVPLSGHPSTKDRRRRKGTAPKPPTLDAPPPDEPEPSAAPSDPEGPPVVEGRPAGFPEEPTTEEVRRLIAALRERTRHRPGKQQLLEGDCRRIALACGAALERGWDPERLAGRLVAELNERIHTPANFLVTKAAELGDPPSSVRDDGTVVVDGRPIDLGAVPWGDSNVAAPPAGPRAGGTQGQQRLVQLAQKVRRRF